MSIQIKRGMKKDLPQLKDGELAFCRDTKELYVGNNGNENVSVTKKVEDRLDAVDSQLEHIKYVDLRQFPRQNGEKNDTNRIQRAIDYINDTPTSSFFDKGYGTLYIPAGVYDVETLILKSNVRIIGDGMGITRLNPVGVGDYVFKTIGTSEKIKLSQCEIRELSISPVCRASEEGYKADVSGIDLKFAERCLISNVRISNITGVGIRNLENYDSIIENLELMFVGVDEQTPALLLDGTPNDSTNALHVKTIRVERCPCLLKITSGARSNQFIGCKFEGGKILIEQCNSNVFSACDFVSTLTTESFIKISTDINDIRGLKFNGCNFIGAPVNESIGIEGGASVISVTFTGCSFTGMKKAIYGNACFNLIGCEFMDCATPNVDILGGKVISCVFAYANGDDAVIKLNGGSILRDCSITSINSEANGISLQHGNAVKDNTLSFLQTGVVCIGNDNIISGNSVNNVTTEYETKDTFNNVIYDKFCNRVN